LQNSLVFKEAAMQDRIAEWKRIFETEENAICKALSRMAWDLATYSCIVAMVQHAPSVGGQKQLNELVMDMLASGFWAGMMQGVRRLVENETIRGPRGVCSLRGLIEDIRAAQSKITRRVYIEDIAGLAYNYESTRTKYEIFARDQLHKGNHSYWVPSALQYELSIERHREFDWLSGISAGKSRPDDLIRIEIFDMLINKLSRLSSVIEHVNVEIAHAAIEASRQGRLLEQWGLHEAKQAVRDIAQVAQLVGNWFCYTGIGDVMPVAHFDKFAHIDAPLFTGERAQLQEVWTEFAREVQQWYRIDPTGYEI
jgi:hypothetical protein